MSGRGAYVRLLAAAVCVCLIATGRIHLGVAGLAAGQAPRRIVSLVPSVTEILFAIGAGPRVVGVSSFDHFPPAVDALPRVGALVDPDIERVLALRPDLVITYGSQTDVSAKLRAAGIATFVYRHGSLADIAAAMRELGRRLGLDREAARAADALEQELAGIRARVQGLARPKTMIVIGREPRSLRGINVSGGYGFLHDLAELAGARNIFADIKRESLLVTAETVLARAPELIIELHYTETASPGLVEHERQTWSVLSTVPAVRHGRIELLFGGELVVPGPRVPEAARAFARAIHPGVAWR